MADRIPNLGPRGEGWVALQVVLIGVIAILGALNLPAVVADWPDGWPLLLQGAVLVAIGAFAVLRGLRDLGPNLTALPMPRDDASLVQHGIYRRLRHPIYGGVMALGLGWSLIGASLPALLAAVALVGLLDLKARREEAWLMERYPEYEAYRRGTARFVPGIY